MEIISMNKLKSNPQFIKKISELAKNHRCYADQMDQFIRFLSSLNSKEASVISQLHFCLMMAPRPNQPTMPYGLCEGFVNRYKDLNPIHVGNTKDIEQRSKRLSHILSHITQKNDLKLVTISRSLRDGYTPRDQQMSIEKNILQTLKDSIRSKHTIRVMYDKQLFGNNGWT